MITIEQTGKYTIAIRVNGVLVIYLEDDGMSIFAVDMINDRYLPLTKTYTISYAVQELIEAGVPDRIHADFIDKILNNWGI